jgi:hypothetical protein
VLYDETNQRGNTDTDLALLPEIRRVKGDNDAWYYNITDVIAALTGTPDPSDYWLKMKKRGKSEGFEASLKKIVQFPMKSRKDGKFRNADCADRETLLRLVQSIPSASPKLEKLKLWLAQVGEERIQENEEVKSNLHRWNNRRCSTKQNQINKKGSNSFFIWMGTIPLESCIPRPFMII